MKSRTLGLIVGGFLLVAACNQDPTPYSGPIIDMHLHAAGVVEFGVPAFVCTNDQEVQFPGLNPQNPITVEKAQQCDHPLPSPGSVDDWRDQTLALLDTYNIYAVTFGDAGEVQPWLERSPDRVIPGRGWGDDYDGKNIKALRLDFEAENYMVFGEIGAQYRGLIASDPVLDGYFALAENLDIPVGIHVGEGPTGGPHIDGIPEYRAALSSSLQLEEVLIKHPKLRLYIMHYGSPLVEDTIALLYSHPQVYVDISQNNWGFPRAHFYRQLKMLVDAGFEKRIMFGSDQMNWPGTIPVAIETIQKAEFLTEAQKADIFYNNAARFLRLSKEEISRHHTKN